jgi:putative tryptophan/tyrosine transport system substrate-binding protein
LDDLTGVTLDAVDAVADLANRSSDYMTDPAVNVHGLVMGNWDEFRRSADFVDKILRGAKPADIPVEQPSRFDLVINLTTANALGLTIPEPFLLRADEVIE